MQSTLLSYLKTAQLQPETTRLGILANQTAFEPGKGYLFRTLAAAGFRLRCFLPEHGLFAELQDQIGLEETQAYARFLPPQYRLQVEFESLYGFQESTLRPGPDRLSDLDLLIVDLQDVGSRYYTFLNTLFYCLEVINDLRSEGRSIRCLVLDRNNPIGRRVEGSPLSPEFESFVGLPGILHRHGLTTGEMARYFATRIGCESSALITLKADAPSSANDEKQSNSADERVFPIYPSPNMPSIATAAVYPGQCLLEGTNLSEGRGTTRPFEIFGAPFLGDLMEDASDFYLPGATLRPLRFLPTFHKHGGTICEGFQIHAGPDYPALFGTMRILRWIRNKCAEFAWLSGVYEFRSNRPAIELLCGDDRLLHYVRQSDAPSVRELDAVDLELLTYLRTCEKNWISDTGFLFERSATDKTSEIDLASGSPLVSSSEFILKNR